MAKSSSIPKVSRRTKFLTKPSALAMPQRSTPTEIKSDRQSTSVSHDHGREKKEVPSLFDIPSEYLDDMGYIKSEFFDQLPSHRGNKDMTVEEVNAMDDLYYVPWKFGSYDVSKLMNSDEDLVAPTFTGLNIDFECCQAEPTTSEASYPWIKLTGSWLLESLECTTHRELSITAQKEGTK